MDRFIQITDGTILGLILLFIIIVIFALVMAYWHDKNVNKKVNESKEEYEARFRNSIIKAKRGTTIRDIKKQFYKV